MITIIAYHPDGFEVRVEVESSAQIEDSIKFLLKYGYRPAREIQLTPDGLPICPRHGLPMTKREKQGDTWYSHNMGTPEEPRWCRGYRHDTKSPGWSLG